VTSLPLGVPAAGLSGVIASSTIIVTAGMAEIAAGSIAMGLGGYLAAKSDAEHFASFTGARPFRSALQTAAIGSIAAAAAFGIARLIG
jgi:hypothetical protein